MARKDTTPLALTEQILVVADVTATVSPEVALDCVVYVLPTSGMAGGVERTVIEFGRVVESPAVVDHSQLSKVASSPQYVEHVPVL